jgi:hypothetical protein
MNIGALEYWAPAYAGVTAEIDGGDPAHEPGLMHHLHTALDCAG